MCGDRQTPAWERDAGPDGGRRAGSSVDSDLTLSPRCTLFVLSWALSHAELRSCKISQLKSFSRKGNQQPRFAAEKLWP